MIALALLAATAPVRVCEIVDPSAREVSIQAIAQIPKLSDREANAIDLLVDEIPRTVSGYSRRDMMDTTNGDPIRCVAGPDYVRISFSVPPQNLKAGLSLLEALVHNSELAPPEKPWTPKRASAWGAALRPYQPTALPRQADVQELYRTLFRSENLTLAIGGPIVPGEVREDWQHRVDQWPTIRYRESAIAAEPKMYLKNPSGLASVELTGPTFTPSDAALPTRTLVLFALGSGKGASLFRVIRQKLGYSYRQEALLYPVPGGWQPRLIMVMKPVEDLVERGANAQKALLEDVAQWKEADLQRALGMADAVFNRGVDFSPFAFGASGAMDGTLQSRTFLSAYWQLKAGQPWDATNFLAQMKTVTLSDLKETATKMLTESQIRILPG